MSRRFLTVSLLVFVLLLGALMLRNAALALMSLPFVVYVGLGLLDLPQWEKVRLSAERTLDVRRAGLQAEVGVRVHVRNEGAPLGSVLLFDLPQPGMTVVDGTLEQAGCPGTGEAVELAYTFRAARGCFRWSSIAVVVGDPFLLFSRTLSLPTEQEAVVKPRVRPLPPFTLHPGRTLHSPGVILSGLEGSGTDFWGVREYQPGDPMRRLDWRRAARHPRQLFTREFEREEIADFGIVLDARAQCDVRCGEEHLFDHALEAAASLSEMVLRGGNRAGLVVLGERLRVVLPGYGKVQRDRILRALADARPGLRASRLSMDQVPLREFSTRAMILVISPWNVAEWTLFARLRARGNEGLLLSPDPIAFRVETAGASAREAAQDRAGRLAARLARLERRLELRRIARLGIRVVDWPVRSPLLPLIRPALQAARGARA